MRILMFCLIFIVSIQSHAYGVRKIKEIKLVYDTSIALSPGAIVPLKWYATLIDGRIVPCKKRFRLNISVQGGEVLKRKLHINSDPVQIKNHRVILSASLIMKPSVKFTDTLYLNYKGNVVFNFSGKKGNDRFSLLKRGRKGSESCPNGGNGSDGKLGKNGGNGNNIKIYVAKDTSCKWVGELLKLEVRNQDGGVLRYLLDPSSAHAKILSQGGKGGDGENGGRGGCGKDESENNNAGSGGDGGDGGNGGNGGDGGLIEVYYLPECLIFLENGTIKFSIKGGRKGYRGSGGRGGHSGSGAKKCRDGHDGIDGHSGYSGGEGRLSFIEKDDFNLDW